MPALQLFLLGPLDLRLDDREVPKPPTIKSQSLLAYLALHRQQRQPRERLADLFWGDRPERRARRSLATALWHIRRCLPDEALLLSDVKSAQFDPQADLWLDVAEFESLVVRPDAWSLQSGIALYRGDFMEGFYDDWVLNERYRLETLYSEALAQLMTGLELRGQYHDALAVALRLLEHDPLREDAHRLAMRAFCRLGQRNAALEQYRRCQEIVQEELGAEPMSGTTELHQTILHGDYDVGPPIEAPAAGGMAAELALSLGHNPLDPIVRSTLMGRETEMAFLQGCYETAQSGQRGGLVLISGEAGVGKTRLLEEFADQLRWQGVRVLWGRCYEFERLLPYQPMVEALQGIVGEIGAPGMKALPTWVLGELVQLVPQLSEELPEFKVRPETPSDQERTHLFEGVARFLASLATKSGLLLVLDDLHWVTESTLHMVHYLARNVAHRRVLIVGTLRPEEVGPQHPLAALRQQLEREGLVRLLDLACLSQKDLEAIVLEMSGSTDTVALLAHRLYEETEGNPFFLMETVKALFEAGLIDLEGGAWSGDFARISEAELPLPTAVSEAIEARVRQLNESDRQALRVAAVLGREFDFHLLNSAWGQQEEGTLEALETLLRRRFVEEGSGVLARDYVFHHHRIREVVYAGIPLRHRQRLHGRAGKAMETLYAENVEEMAGELAFHFGEAREVEKELAPKAVHYLLLGGDQARLAYAHHEAIEYYSQALSLQKEQGNYERAARTLMKLGLTYHTGFDFAQARRAFDGAFSLRKKAEATPPAQGPVAPHALRLPWYEPVTLDPGLASDIYSVGVSCHLFTGLVELSPDMDVVPGVAQNWDMSEGGRRFVFRLRDDVRWSDGKRVTAHDFEYAWKRALELGTASQNAKLLLDVKGARELWTGETRETDRLGVRALDALTLEVELEEPAVNFLHLLTTETACPVPKHLVEALGGRWTEPGNIVTNGPFMLAEWRPGESMRLVSNPGYFGRLSGNVHEVALAFLPAVRSAELEMYGAGELDVATLQDPPIVDLARGRFPGEYVSFPILSTLHVGFDVSRPPFDDPRVRRALTLAVDREQLADVHLGGQVFPATGGFVPPGMPGHSAGIGLPHDPEQARRLLDEAGYPGGRGFPVAEALAPGLRVDERVESRQLQAYWSDNLGLEIRWQALDVGAWLDRLNSEPPHLHLTAWMAQYPDPDDFLRAAAFRRRNRWQNDVYDRLVEEAQRATTPAIRIKLYQKADKILVEEAPIMPIYYDRGHLLLKPWVTRFPTSSLRWYGHWHDAIVEPH
jgi:ABC-type oligopeptide transport system substrate-binding subunit/DNA-binding SARP family transcriptional activator